MTRTPSILNRIILLHLAAFAGISAAIIAAAFLLLSATVNQFEETVLKTHAETIAHYLSRGNDGWSLALPSELASDYRKKSGDFALSVVTSNGQTLFSSFPNPVSLPFALDVKAEGELSYQQVGDSTFYRLVLPKRLGDQTAWIMVGQNLENPNVIVDDVLRDFAGKLAWIALPILALIFLVDIMLLRRQFRPVVAASRAAAAIEPNNLPARLTMQELPREVLPLATAFNQALERLEQALRAQREFSADAAHELRTPLAILRAEIDVSVDAGTAQKLHADVDAMSRILDQLLELAELEGENLATDGSANLATVAADVVSLMAPLALLQNRTLELSSDITPPVVHGNHHMLARALRNLIENGIRYAPSGGHVVVMVRAPGTLIVSDNGPGIPEQDRQKVFRRFWRRNSHEGGAGLGLAIVAKIIKLHGGHIEAAENLNGGAKFLVTLPPARV